jgi:hypothetical protein
LPSSDIEAALKTICGPNPDAYKGRLLFMTEYFNDCYDRKVESIAI